MTLSAGSSSLNREFEAVLRECLAGLIAPDAPLHEDTDLTVLGIDSLIVVRLLVMLEDSLGVTVPEEILTFEIFSSPGVLWNLISDIREEQGDR
jgi:acyl carrier protein